jgi:peptide/nickel transport system substrate-binding protein
MPPVDSATLDAIRRSVEERALSRRDFVRLTSMGLAATALPSVLLGCGSDGDSGTAASAPKGFVYSQSAESSPLDPHTAVGEVTETVNTVMYDRLINRDLTKAYPDQPSPPIVPVLAESFEGSEDAKTFTFKIREGVKFHDGTVLDAAAVKWNIERMGVKDAPHYFETAGAVTAFLWRYLDGIETPDGRTVVLHLSKSFSELPSMMCESTGNPAMISPAQVKKVGNEKFGDQPVGTGPYVFESRKRGESIRFKANPAPWKGCRTPASPDITFRPITDLSARVNALRSGAVHGINFPSPDVVAELGAGGDFKVHTGQTPAVYYLSFNLREKPFDDVRVRQAINHAIDREAIAKDLWGGVVNPWDQVVAPTSGTAAEDVQGYEYDPERAKALLAEAGFPDGFDTVFEANDTNFEPTPSAVVEQLAQVGVRAKLEMIEWLTYFGRWAEGMKPGVGINIMSWGMNSPWWLNHPFENFNTGHIDDKEITQLLRRADGEMDEPKRLAIYQQVSKLAVERAYHAPLYADTLPVITRSGVENFVHANNWWFDLSTVTVA